MTLYWANKSCPHGKQIFFLASPLKLWNVSVNSWMLLYYPWMQLTLSNCFRRDKLLIYSHMLKKLNTVYQVTPRDISHHRWSSILRYTHHMMLVIIISSSTFTNTNDSYTNQSQSWLFHSIFVSIILSASQAILTQISLVDEEDLPGEALIIVAWWNVIQRPISPSARPSSKALYLVLAPWFHNIHKLNLHR
jgi:hypothetical protein